MPAADLDPDVVEGFQVVASDGATATLSCFPLPPGSAPAPVVLCLAAMGIEARYYAGFAGQLRRLGLNAATLELRGMGTSSVRPSHSTDYGYGTILERDLPPAISRLRERFPGSPLFLLGHSLGGQLSALFLALHPEEVEGLVLIASGTPHYAIWPWPQRWVVYGMGVIFPAVAAIVGYFPGEHISFAGKESRGMIREWARIVREGRFRLDTWNGRDPEEALGEVRAPVLGISLVNDRLTPPAVMDHLLGKMPHARVERFLYDHREHGEPPVDHVRWPKHPRVIAERSAAWILSQAKAR